MPPIIVDQPWPPNIGEDLRHTNGQFVVCPTTGDMGDMLIAAARRSVRR